MHQKHLHDFMQVAKVGSVTRAGTFIGPTVSRQEIENQFNVQAIGVVTDLVSEIFTISVERRVRPPCVLAITQAARDKLLALPWTRCDQKVSRRSSAWTVAEGAAGAALGGDFALRASTGKGLVWGIGRDLSEDVCHSPEGAEDPGHGAARCLPLSAARRSQARKAR
jgi:hypothetical protein